MGSAGAALGQRKSAIIKLAVFDCPQEEIGSVLRNCLLRLVRHSHQERRDPNPNVALLGRSR